MQVWIWISCAAALAQTLRFMFQKQLAATGLSAAGATYARFVYSAPLVAMVIALYLLTSGQEVPALPTRFWFFAALGGVAQILATILVVHLFSLRNFAVGITLKKTEVMQTVLVGLILLGDRVSVLGFLAILTGFAGVLFLSNTPKGQAWRLDRAAWLGLLAGALFGVSGVSYRGASLALGLDDPFLSGGLTLAFVTAGQTLLMTGWFGWRDVPQIGKVLGAWRVAGLVGLTSMVGSFCWFTAYSMQQAAYVNAVGQVELIFSILVSTLVFGERITAREGVGIALITGSILLLILAL